ncbi:hypothetical protein ATCC90586_005068 [Pythium insidiosum]|nr:hypothetical protein ATCC90586_005068 [Pythium insidiosum]
MVRRFVELEPAIGSLDHDSFVKPQLTSVMLDPAEVAQVRLLSEQLAQLDEVTHALEDSTLTLGNYLKAFDCMERALVLRRHFFGAESVEVRHACKALAEMCNLLSMSFLQQDNYSVTLDLLKKAEVLSQHHPAERATTLNNLACYYRRLGKLHTAMTCLKKALDIEKRLQQVRNTADTHLNMCAVLSQLGRHAQALEHAQAALLTLQEAFFAPNNAGEQPQDPRQQLDRVSVMCIAYHNVGVEQEFLQDFDNSVLSYKKVQSLRHCVDAARALTLTEGVCEQGVGMAEQYLGVDHPITTTIRNSYLAAKRTISAKRTSARRPQQLKSPQRLLSSPRGGNGGSGVPSLRSPTPLRDRTGELLSPRSIIAETLARGKTLPPLETTPRRSASGLSPEDPFFSPRFRFDAAPSKAGGATAPATASPHVMERAKDLQLSIGTDAAAAMKEDEVGTLEADRAPEESGNEADDSSTEDATSTVVSDELQDAETTRPEEGHPAVAPCEWREEEEEKGPQNDTACEWQIEAEEPISAALDVPDDQVAIAVEGPVGNERSPMESLPTVEPSSTEIEIPEAECTDSVAADTESESTAVHLEAQEDSSPADESDSREIEAPPALAQDLEVSMELSHRVDVESEPSSLGLVAAGDEEEEEEEAVAAANEGSGEAHSAALPVEESPVTPEGLEPAPTCEAVAQVQDAHAFGLEGPEQPDAPAFDASALGPEQYDDHVNVDAGAEEHSGWQDEQPLSSGFHYHSEASTGVEPTPAPAEWPADEADSTYAEAGWLGSHETPSSSDWHYGSEPAASSWIEEDPSHSSAAAPATEWQEEAVAETWYDAGEQADSVPHADQAPDGADWGEHQWTQVPAAAESPAEALE